MDKRKAILRNIFSLKNVVPVLIITVAFISTFVEAPFGLKREQIIIGLLAFLAIDSLVERFELLSRIDQNLNNAIELFKTRPHKEGFIKSRRDFPRFEKMISSARQEIWISGVSLITVATLTDVFCEMTNNAVKLKFMAVDPDSKYIDESGEYYGFEVDEMETRTRLSLTRLYNHVVQGNTELAEIKTLPNRPGFCYFIVDPDSNNGYMTVAHYLYRAMGSDGYPMFLINKKDDPHWYSVYLKDFCRQWENATSWIPNKQQ